MTLDAHQATNFYGQPLIAKLGYQNLQINAIFQLEPTELGIEAQICQ